MLRAGRVSASLGSSRQLQMAQGTGPCCSGYDLHVISWAEQLWARWIHGWGRADPDLLRRWAGGLHGHRHHAFSSSSFQGIQGISCLTWLPGEAVATGSP